MRVSVVVGSAKERLKALNTDADIYTINYENLPWLVEQFGKDDWPFRIVIADESTRLKGFRMRQGTKRAKALAKVAHSHVDRFIELTGTPSPNGLIDLWGQMFFINPSLLGRSFQAFVSRWFKSERVGADAYAVKLTPLPHAQREIEERLKDVVVSLDPKDWFDLKDPIVNVIKVDLPPKARELYDDMEKELFVELSVNESVEAFNAASRTIKCLQIANGALYTEDKNSVYHEIHDAKIEALESIIEEAAGMPVLVAYQFKSDLDRLQRAFPKGRHLDRNPQTITDWNDGKIPVLFAHPQAAGHGLNLQDGSNVIAFYGLWWSLESHAQILERLGPTRQAQSGYDRPVYVHYIVASNTIDEQVMERLNSKREVQDLLLEAMKNKETGNA